MNPQWGNIGTDMAAMFTKQETPLQVLKNTDHATCAGGRGGARPALAVSPTDTD